MEGCGMRGNVEGRYFVVFSIFSFLRREYLRLRWESWGNGRYHVLFNIFSLMIFWENLRLGGEEGRYRVAPTSSTFPALSYQVAFVGVIIIIFVNFCKKKTFYNLLQNELSEFFRTYCLSWNSHWWQLDLGMKKIAENLV